MLATHSHGEATGARSVMGMVFLLDPSSLVAALATGVASHHTMEAMQEVVEEANRLTNLAQVEAMVEVVEVTEEVDHRTNLALVEVVVMVDSSVSRNLILEVGWEVSRSLILAAFLGGSKNPLCPHSVGNPNPVMELLAVVLDLASQI